MRLGNAFLDDHPADVRVPAYVRRSITPGIVHLGVGAFHRAHQAVYIDDLLSREPNWGIVGASLRSPETADALLPQDGLYTVAVRDGATTRCRVVGSLVDVLVLPRDRERLMTNLCDPAVRIVSMTITEKGYCHDPATGLLDESHPDIVADLTNPATPRSAPGLIVEALARRMASGTVPFTILSCDNLPANGRTARRVVTRFAALRDPGLGAWIASEVAFPSSMVDRIVPATTHPDRAVVAAALGVEDAWPVVTEPFSQWVVEDRFPAGRPRFEDVGVAMVDDVAPFEQMKLRMLNGSHSAIAYLGSRAGHETVADTIEDAAFRRFIHDLMTEEVMPTLSVAGMDLGLYRDALIERFRNRGLRHLTRQIAMDGSQKLPQRLLGTIRDRLAAGASIDRLALAVAGWMTYLRGVDDTGRPHEIRDPLAPRLRTIVDAAGDDPSELYAALAAIRQIFGTDGLAENPAFAGPVRSALADLFRGGAARAVASFT